MQNCHSLQYYIYVYTLEFRLCVVCWISPTNQYRLFLVGLTTVRHIVCFSSPIGFVCYGMANFVRFHYSLWELLLRKCACNSLFLPARHRVCNPTRTTDNGFSITCELYPSACEIGNHDAKKLHWSFGAPHSNIVLTASGKHFWILTMNRNQESDISNMICNELLFIKIYKIMLASKSWKLHHVYRSAKYCLRSVKRGDMLNQVWSQAKAASWCF